MSSIEQVLAQHAKAERFTKPGRRKGLIEWAARCICGHELSWNEEARIAEHRAHVADQIRAHLLSSEVREVAKRAMRGHGCHVVVEANLDYLARTALTAALDQEP